MLRLFSRLLLLLALILGIKGVAWWLYQYDRRQITSGLSYKATQFDSLRTAYSAVFIGSSRTFMSLIPSEFDSLTGGALRSYNFGVADCFAPHSFRLAESLLRRSDLSLQYVFLELSLPNTILPEEPLMLNPLAEVGYRARLWRLYTDLTDGQAWDSWINNYTIAVLSPSTCLHHSLSAMLNQTPANRRLLNPISAVNLPYDFINSPDGYLRDRRLRPAFWTADTAWLPRMHELAKQAFGARPTLPPNESYQADLDNLFRLAEARNIHLLVYLPNRLTVAEARWLPTMFSRIPTANRLQIWPDGRFDALFSPTNSFNRGHLNHQGAQQYTRLMAEAFERAADSGVLAQHQPNAR